MELGPFDQADLIIIGVGAGVVFISDLIGNSLVFSNKFVNAVVTGLVFAIIFAGLHFAEVWG